MLILLNDIILFHSKKLFFSKKKTLFWKNWDFGKLNITINYIEKRFAFSMFSILYYFMNINCEWTFNLFQNILLFLIYIYLLFFILWLCGNSRAHTSQYVKNHLDHSCFTLLKHPAYYPDLSPCNFGLFGTVKESFKGKSFDSEEELLQAIGQFFSEKSKEFWQTIFQDWLRRLRACILAKGDYFWWIKIIY